MPIQIHIDWEALTNIEIPDWDIPPEPPPKEYFIISEEVTTRTDTGTCITAQAVIHKPYPPAEHDNQSAERVAKSKEAVELYRKKAKTIFQRTEAYLTKYLLDDIVKTIPTVNIHRDLGRLVSFSVHTPPDVTRPSRVFIASRWQRTLHILAVPIILTADLGTCRVSLWSSERETNPPEWKDPGTVKSLETYVQWSYAHTTVFQTPAPDTPGTTIARQSGTSYTETSIPTGESHESILEEWTNLVTRTPQKSAPPYKSQEILGDIVHTPDTGESPARQNSRGFERDNAAQNNRDTVFGTDDEDLGDDYTGMDDDWEDSGASGSPSIADASRPGVNPFFLTNGQSLLSKKIQELASAIDEAIEAAAQFPQISSIVINNLMALKHDVEKLIDTVYMVSLEDTMVRYKLLVKSYDFQARNLKMIIDELAAVSP
jgi:hypothetical protein